MKLKSLFHVTFVLLALSPAAQAIERPELRVGIAGHAFDHLAGIADQGDAVIASGFNIIYPSGVGAMGYEGLPKPEEFADACKKAAAYVRQAKERGVKLSIAYVCSTSIVNLNTFDKNWTKEFRAQFATPPAQWLQQDRDGKPLPSWYGGNYLPACKNNPDWRTYEKFIVKTQLELGNDGVFFDNPTVHPQGCYCEHCMKKFVAFLAAEGVKIDLPATGQIPFLRQVAVSRASDFLRFRSTTARDFLAEMRSYAHTIKPDALMTCNNSLNTSDVLFSQARTYGYNIYEMSKTEDLVVVEDMATQPRVLPDGNVVEYGPTYELLQAISHGKPVVACALADGDYHTAPNLVRLAMAEAAAHRSSYLAWPTWPENVRQRLAATIRPQADFLRTNASLLNDVQPRADVLLYFPFRKYLNTPDCWATRAATALTRANIPFQAICEDEIVERLNSDKANKSILLLESVADLNAGEKESVEQFQQKHGRMIFAEKDDWLTDVKAALGQPSIVVDGPNTVRAAVADQDKQTIIHLLNLNIHDISSFDDKVSSAANVRIKVRVPLEHVESVSLMSADASRQLQFTVHSEKGEHCVEITIPELKISAIIVVK